MGDCTVRLLWVPLASPQVGPLAASFEADIDPSLLSSPSWLRLPLGQLGWSTPRGSSVLLTLHTPKSVSTQDNKREISWLAFSPPSRPCVQSLRYSYVQDTVLGAFILSINNSSVFMTTLGGRTPIMLIYREGKWVRLVP